MDLNYRNISVETLFQEIQKQTGYSFVFNYEKLGSTVIPAVAYRATTVEAVLKDVLAELGHEFTFEDNVIVVRPTVVQQQPQMYSVTGRVTDAGGRPLSGIHVILTGTTTATATDANGQFSLRVPVDKGTLRISSIGFQEQTVSFEAGKPVNVKLKEAVEKVDEVQVIAYGTRSKRDLISSISSVNAEDMKELPTDNLLSMLQGRMAGVQITQQGGSPGGGGSNIIIRGLSSIEGSAGGSDGMPLFVIDGVPMYTFISPTTGSNALADLDPTTIESVEVLKDAASGGIYGSRAGNGVVLITTKRGKAGEANFSANVSFSTSHLPETPFQLLGVKERQFAMDMLKNYRSTNDSHNWMFPESYTDSYGKAGLEYDYWWRTGASTDSPSHPALQDSLNEYYNNQTNWWDKYFRNAKVINANIQASGGSEKFTYMMSGGYYTEEGININSSFSRASMLFNMSAKPTKSINIDGRVHLSYTDKSRNKRNNSFNQSAKFEGLSANPSTTSSLDPADGSRLDAGMKKFLNTIVKNDNYRMMSNLRVGIDLYKGITFTTNLGVDLQQANSNIFEPSSVTGQNEGNQSTGSITRNLGLTNENLLSYSNRFGEHYVDVLAGLSLTSDEYHYLAGRARFQPSEQIHYVPNGSSSVTNSAADQYYNSNFIHKTMVSYFGRVAYNYKRRYLVEATYRRDGSSVFGEKVRYANFPTIAVGWVFSDETFMDALSWLDLGKLRASWGKSGQIYNDAYLAHGLMGGNGTGSLGTYVGAGDPINQYLTWEKTEQYNIGLDMDILNYRVKLKFDYYYRNTNGLLEDVRLPGNFLGSNYQVRNAKGVSNEGIEMEAIVDIFRQGEFRWRTMLNLSRNWNKFRNSYNNEDINPQVLGKPLYNLKVYYDEGYFQNYNEIPFIYSPDGSKIIERTGASEYSANDVGMKRIRDLDGNGIINGDDMYFAGSTFPVVDGGWTNQLRWKDFDASILVTFALGRKMVNNYKYTSMQVVPGNMKPLYMDVDNTSFWREEGDNSTLPVMRYFSQNLIQYSGILRSRIETVHYARLKQLTLGYNVPQTFTSKFGLSGLRVFFTGENLFIVHNYSGLDPEVVKLSTGIDDFDSYPLARKWTIGLTIKF